MAPYVPNRFIKYHKKGPHLELGGINYYYKIPQDMYKFDDNYHHKRTYKDTRRRWRDRGFK